MPEKNLRTKQLNIRLTQNEYEKLQKKADEHNLGMATFLRDRILELSPPVERVHDLPKIDPELIAPLAELVTTLTKSPDLLTLKTLITVKLI